MIPNSRETQAESATDAPTVVGEPEKEIPTTEEPVVKETASSPVALVPGVQTRNSKYLQGEEYCCMSLLEKEVENLRKQLSTPGSGLDRGVK